VWFVLVELNFGSFVPLSTVDWYGRAVCVVFFRGCPLRCSYCHNYSLFEGECVVGVDFVEREILQARKFISGVVFSGGEPCAQPEALESLCGFVRDLGLVVGVESNGFYPDVLASLVESGLVDRVFLDVKAPLSDRAAYGRIIEGNGVDTCFRVSESLEIVKGMVEVRSTLFRSFADRGFVEGIARELVDAGCVFVLQQGDPSRAWREKIRFEKPLSRDEMLELGRVALGFLDEVRIRTREKGEEVVV
jgi:pyruvate formate lyase activating enzyme